MSSNSNNEQVASCSVEETPSQGPVTAAQGASQQARSHEVFNRQQFDVFNDGIDIVAPPSVFHARPLYMLNNTDLPFLNNKNIRYKVLQERYKRPLYKSRNEQR